MHSTEPEKARPDGMEGETFSTFKMAGSRGNLKTVLTQEDILLELNNGNYLRLSHNKVEAMRHHQFHIVPHWCGVIAMLMIYSSIRILTGIIQIWIGLIGVGIIISWLGFRKSALTIDSGEGGTYTLFGNDIELIKFRVIVERVKDGLTLEKAIEGVDEVIMTEYPSSSIFEELVDSIENEINDNTDALTMAMTDLINKSNTGEHENKLESESIPEVIEEQITETREPHNHGSISRARRVQTEIRTTPVHTGWANVANRTENIRTERVHSEYERFNSHPTDQIIPNEMPSVLPSQSSDESFNMFGFDFEESKSEEEPFNMFGDNFESTPSSEINFSNEEYPQSSFTMMPDSVKPPNQNFSYEKVEQSQPFINSFQQTGYTNSLNQLGATLENYNSINGDKEPIEKQLPGIVSQAKVPIDEKNIEVIKPSKNTERLKRISFKHGTKKLKRLSPKKSNTKRVTLVGMFKSSLNLKTPSFLRNRVSKNSSIERNFVSDRKVPGRTMDALKVQAHHSHEAQLADALRMINKDDEDSGNDYLEDISPDLVERTLPTSFQELKASNDSQKDVLSTTGISRLD